MLKKSKNFDFLEDLFYLGDIGTGSYNFFGISDYAITFQSSCHSKPVFLF